MVSQNVAEIIKNHVTLEAQEKAAVFRTIHKRNAETGKAYPWISRGQAMPNHYYFYLLDEDFGPLSIKFCSYFEQETLRFMIDARVPFTKNQGENDIRMAKVHLDGKLPEFIL